MNEAQKITVAAARRYMTSMSDEDALRWANGRLAEENNQVFGLPLGMAIAALGDLHGLIGYASDEQTKSVAAQATTYQVAFGRRFQIPRKGK